MSGDGRQSTEGGTGGCARRRKRKCGATSRKEENRTEQRSKKGGAFTFYVHKRKKKATSFALPLSSVQQSKREQRSVQQKTRYAEMRVEMQVCGARAGGRVYGGFLIVRAIERGTRNKEDKKRARGHECEKGG